MIEHPINQPIKSITVNEFAHRGESYSIGENGVTRIEATFKSGVYSDLPYIRIWRGDIALAEFCQHNIVGVYFEQPHE